MSKVVSRSEAGRLGKRGSYRLGAVGPAPPEPPRPPRRFQMSFLGPQHRGSVTGWVLVALVGVVLIAGAALLGVWFMPFVIGLATGVLMRWGWWRLRVTIPAVVIVTCAGWGVALLTLVVSGQAVGPTAQTIAAVAGFPGMATVAFAVTLGVSSALGLVGLWLGRALAPRPARI